MKYRDFGRTGFKVSVLGLGCMRLPVYRFFPVSVKVKKAIRLIRSSIDMGINYMDTAYLYHFGASERILGAALKDGYREKVHLVTKLPMNLVNKTEDFNKYLYEQLKKLDTSRIDTYLFHSLDENNFRKVVHLDLIKEMEKARDRGLIKNIGFSFHDTLPVFKKIIDHYSWDVVQIQYNYLDTNIQATTRGLEYAYDKNMAVVIMEPLKGGLLVKPPEEAMKLLNSSEIKRTPVEWALDFLWNRKEVSVVLSGMSSEEMLKENCSYADNSGIGSMSEADNKILEQVVNIYKKQILIPCTACSYCMPCPFGVNIPDNFAIINFLNTRPGNLSDRFFRFKTRKKYRRLADDPTKVDKIHPNGNASICTSCGICVEKCPQKINIPAELEKINSVMGKKERIEKVFGREK